jgi:uncharacterized membrane protein (DUF373 family)
LFYFYEPQLKEDCMEDDKLVHYNSKDEGASLVERANSTHGGRQHESEDRFALFSVGLLERADTFIYAAVGVCFLLGALIALGYSFWDFGTAMSQVPAMAASARPGLIASAIIKFISDLLLVLIITEVLGTVTHYLKAHATSLRPFLFIGIISATRGILSIGARLSVEQVTTEEFPHAMIELGVNAGVVLALGLTLWLLGKHFEKDGQGI